MHMEYQSAAVASIATPVCLYIVVAKTRAHTDRAHTRPRAHFRLGAETLK